MGLIERAKQDAQRYTSDKDGFAVDITLIAPDTTTVTIAGLSTRHHLAIDQMSGEVVSSRTASISFSEAVAVAAGYVVRDSTQEVNFRNHRAQVTDSAGILRSYIIDKWLPDETLGLIVCILGDYE